MRQKLPATVTWLGNSLPGARAWVQMEAAALAVAADGSVFTNTPWEEGGGEAGQYRDGRLLGYGIHTHGWGVRGGRAVAVNAAHVFLAGRIDSVRGRLVDPQTWPPKGRVWLGISRRLRSDFRKGAPVPDGRGGKGDTLPGAFRIVADVAEGDAPEVVGLSADDARVWACDTATGKLSVYAASDLTLLGRVAIDAPGPLAADGRGGVWRLAHRTLQRHDAGGAPDGPPIPLPDGRDPVALCVASDGDLWLADSGPAHQIFRFDPGRRRTVATLGERGGVFAEVRGRVGAGRFCRPHAVGCLPGGNLVVAHHRRGSGGGNVLEGYAPDGRRLWNLTAMAFLDCADVDPLDEASVFTKEERYVLEAGGARLAATTLDPERYPQDPRLGRRASAAWVRRIAGRRFLFVLAQASDWLAGFRFDGEIAAPSVFVTPRSLTARDGGAPAGQPASGGWLWRDRNGDGRFAADEYEGLGKVPAAQAWWIDRGGDLWLATERDGIWRFPCDGLDPAGNVVWRPRSKIVYPHPDGFERVKRLRYDPESDTMYLGGTTAEHRNQHWMRMGPALARWDGWLRGARTHRWQTVLPYRDGVSGHLSTEPSSFDIAGEYVFVADTIGPVRVLKAEDGSAAGTLELSAEVGAIGLQDLRESLRAWRRRDGEYLVFLEDDLKAKVLLYRWRP